MVDLSVITDVNNIITALTVTLIPTIGSLVLGINNYIKHHFHSQRTDDLTAKVANIEGKLMVYDKQISEKSGDIAIGADVVASQFPQVKDAIVNHQAQINQFNQKLKDLTDEINRIKAVIPQN